ncbi:hypothetical protein D3C87_1631180 [compost metagenome]
MFYKVSTSEFRVCSYPVYINSWILILFFPDQRIIQSQSKNTSQFIINNNLPLKLLFYGLFNHTSFKSLPLQYTNFTLISCGIIIKFKDGIYIFLCTLYKLHSYLFLRVKLSTFVNYCGTMNQIFKTLIEAIWPNN